jgi:hypothetical protein
MMKTIAAITGGIGGLCAVMGIITALSDIYTALEFIDPDAEHLSWMFWFVLAAILLLGDIAMTLGRGSEVD